MMKMGLHERSPMRGVLHDEDGASREKPKNGVGIRFLQTGLLGIRFPYRCQSLTGNPSVASVNEKRALKKQKNSVTVLVEDLECQ
jgi:hypothetical protein